MSGTDPIVDMLLACDLPRIAEHARHRRLEAAAAGDVQIAAVWKLAEQVCTELMPVPAARHTTVQPALFVAPQPVGKLRRR